MCVFPSDFAESRDRDNNVILVPTLIPDFEAPDQSGAAVRLSDFRGRWVVLWWYPKASTPG